MAALRWLSLGPSTVSPKVKDVEKSCCFGGMRLRHRTTDPVPTQSCSVYKCTTSCFICSSSAYPWILLTLELCLPRFVSVHSYTYLTHTWLYALFLPLPTILLYATYIIHWVLHTRAVRTAFILC